MDEAKFEEIAAYFVDQQISEKIGINFQQFLELIESDRWEYYMEVRRLKAFEIGGLVTKIHC